MRSPLCCVFFFSSDLRAIAFVAGVCTSMISSARFHLQILLFHGQLSTICAGAIWFSLCSHNQFSHRALNGNYLIGTIPSYVVQLPSLTSLCARSQTKPPLATDALCRYLNDNALSGTIPRNFRSPSPLRELWLNDNQLSGSIPPTLGVLFNLVGLCELFMPLPITPSMTLVPPHAEHCLKINSREPFPHQLGN